MSDALQIALFAAAMAIALFLFLMIPLSILLYRRAIRFSQQLEELNTELKGLVQDSRTMVQNISAVTNHVNDQLGELDSIVGITRKWSESAEHVVAALGAMVEVPLFKATRSIKALYQAWRFIASLVDGTRRQTSRKDEANRETHR